MIDFVTVEADDIAQAWLDTVLAVAAQPQQKALHSVTRIGCLTDDGEARILAAAADLLDEFDLQPLDTIANTIFPAAMAQRTPDIGVLTERYEDIYPQLKRLNVANRFGTYFHRLVAYPGRNGPVNQLERVITNMRRELTNPAPKRVRYETSLEVPAGASEGSDGAAAQDAVSGDAPAADTGATPVFAADRDTRSMGFPCLSFLSFQHDRSHVHAVAHYRSQHLLERGLGNYLGIARLVRYLAEQVGLAPGGLTVVAGQAFADHLRKLHLTELAELRQALREMTPTSVEDAQPADAR